MKKSKIIHAIALTNLIITSGISQAETKKGCEEKQRSNRIENVQDGDHSPNHNGCCGGATCNGSC
ncbi:MAG: hypothetical protein AB8G05_13375 [Oligoflexales bacterium]